MAFSSGESFRVIADGLRGNNFGLLWLVLSVCGWFGEILGGSRWFLIFQYVSFKSNLNLKIDKYAAENLLK